MRRREDHVVMTACEKSFILSLKPLLYLKPIALRAHGACMSCTTAGGSVLPDTPAHDLQARRYGTSSGLELHCGHDEEVYELIHMPYIPFSLCLEVSASPEG